MAAAERDATYTMGRSEGETGRLIEQAHLYEKMTLRMLRDAVIGRLVLMYLADPAEALKSFAARMRPGGIVAFQEAEMTLYETIAHPDTPVVNRLVEWGLEVFRRSGANIGMGLELQGAFVDAGLPSPVANLEAPAGAGPDWAGYEYLQQGFASLLPLIESFGIATAEEVAVETLAGRLRREAAASGRLIVLPPHVTAYARMPA